jgi:hypothetical protein
MTEIQPVVVPTKGTGKYFDITALNFPMDPQSVTFYWQVFSQATLEDGTVQPGQCILDGNLIMDQETYAGWGNNDSYVIDWACDQLGFTII